MTHRRTIESPTANSRVLRSWKRTGLVMVLALSTVVAAVGTAGQRAGDGRSGVTANDCGWTPGFHIAGLSGGVNALAVFDDGSGPALYAGGEFISAGETMVHSIAMWDGSAWQPLSGPSGTGMTGWKPTVNALVVFDDGTGPALYAGGQFATAGGVQANNIAKWDGARWSALPGLLGRAIDTLAVYDDGTGPALYAGGIFTEVGPGDVTVNRIARFDGSAWHPLSGPSGTGVEGNYPHVAALAVYDDGSGPALYLGGRFDTAGGVTANHLAKWDGEEYTALEGPFGIGIDERVHTLAVYDNGTGPALFVGGLFDTAGGVTANNIARWDGSTFTALDGPTGTGTNHPVNAFSVYDDGSGPALYIGGEQTAAGGVHVGAIARWDGEAFSAVTGLSGQPSSGIVSALAVYDDGTGAALVASGYLGVPDVEDTDNVTKWNGSEFSALSGPGGNGVNWGSVYSFAEYDDGTGPELYVGGGFDTAGGVSANRIARWDGSGFSALGAAGDNGTSATVYALDVYDDGSGSAMYIGGEFVTAGGITVHGIARWDGVDFSGLGDAASPGAPGGEIRALEVFDDGTGPALYVGGYFPYIGELGEAYNIAKWDGSTFSVVGSGTNGVVYALEMFDDGTGPALYMGGGFETAGGVEVDGIAKWDGAGFSALRDPSGSGISGIVLALAVFDDGSGPALYMGGHLGFAGGNSIDEGIVKWDGRDFTALQSADGSSIGGSSPSVEALTVYDDGTGPALFIGGTFEVTGGVTANHIVKWDGEAFSAVDGPLGAGPDRRVSALSSYDDGTGPALFAGGFFTMAGGFPANHIASWQCEQQNPFHLKPRTPSGRVRP